MGYRFHGLGSAVNGDLHHIRVIVFQDHLNDSVCGHVDDAAVKADRIIRVVSISQEPDQDAVGGATDSKPQFVSALEAGHRIEVDPARVPLC